MVANGSRGLSIRGLSVNYHTPRGIVRALRNVDLDVPPGSVVGVVGESGCGKSSLIGAIISQLPDNARIADGEIVFGEANLLKLASSDMRQLMGDRISVVFQDPMTSLNPIRSIGRQMADLQYRTARGRAEKLEVAARMLRKVGISDPEHRLRQFPFQFSGGMRQRVSIAMALMASPDLLIADEPTTALDATLEVQIVSLLRQLQQEIGCSILFVSHHLGVVAELCDYVVVLYAGEVAEAGNVRDIFHNSRHPYTRRLLACDPGLIETPSRRLPTIAGEIPNLVDIPLGCIFAPRCSAAYGHCFVQAPDSYQVGPGHRAVCHIAAETGRS
ncbi:MAG: ABC transporter ATP-binding protein [Mesorhizobium sp.]|nr:MAG: ABC transporter ATP-binding protein [Mesorhizobium sp.]